jgi:hypothetical protein
MQILPAAAAAAAVVVLELFAFLPKAALAQGAESRRKSVNCIECHEKKRLSDQLWRLRKGHTVQGDRANINLAVALECEH